MADLVHPFQAADDEALEVELVGNAEVQLHVQRIVAGDEWPGRGPAIERLENGRLHLEESPIVEELPDPAHRPGAEPEDLAHFGVHRQVGIALAIADLGIGEAAEGDVSLFGGAGLAARERPERLGEQFHRPRPDSHFPGPGAEEAPPDTHVIVQVEQLYQGPERLERVATEIGLDPAARVLDVGERGLPLRAKRDDPAGHGHFRAVIAHGVVVQLESIQGVVGPLEAVGVGLDPQLLEALAPEAALLLDLGPGVVVGHAAVPPNCFR